MRRRLRNYQCRHIRAKRNIKLMVHFHLNDRHLIINGLKSYSSIRSIAYLFFPECKAMTCADNIQSISCHKKYITLGVCKIRNPPGTCRNLPEPAGTYPEPPGPYPESPGTYPEPNGTYRNHPEPSRNPSEP